MSQFPPFRPSHPPSRVAAPIRQQVQDEARKNHMKDRLTAGVVASAIMGGALLIAIVIVWGAFWTGLTLSALWGWFITPVFGLPALSIAQAYGLALVAWALRGTRHEPKSDDGFGVLVAKCLTTPPFAAGLFMLVGWVAKGWM